MQSFVLTGNSLQRDLENSLALFDIFKKYLIFLNFVIK